MSESMLGAVDERSTTINIRASVRQKNLIDRAAQALGKTRTEFMLEVASRSAEEVLIDQRFFIVDDKAFEEFLNVLSAPVESSEKLQRLLRRKAPWE